MRLLPDNVRVLAWGLPALVVVAGAAALPGGLGRLPDAPMALGEASYALYLSHVFVMLGFSALLRGALRAGVAGPITVSGLALIAMVVSIAVGQVVHRRIEVPLARFMGLAVKKEPAPSSLGRCW